MGHPGPGVAKPSVTGVVYSYDQGATRYAAITGIQQPRLEIIESLQEIMEQALGRFIEFNKRPPRRLIFFRDGVSEGEYNAVLTAELAAIHGTLRSIFALNVVKVEIPFFQLRSRLLLAAEIIKYL